MQKFSSMYITEKRWDSGNARIVIAAAEGIIKATDRTMLIENGGHIQLTLAWAYSLLQRMGFVQRKATTETKISLSKSEFELAKKSYLKRIKKAVADAKIPAELVNIWDQTGVNVVPVDTGRERFITSGNCWSWG